MFTVDRFLKVHVLLLGIIQDGEKHQKFEKYLFILFATLDSIVIIALGIAFTSAEDLSHQTWIAAVFAPVFVNVLYRILGHRRRTHLLSIMAKFRFDSSTNKVENNAFFIFAKNFGPGLTFFFLGLLYFQIGPYVRCYLTSDRDYNDPDLYVVPYLFHFWNVHSFLGYLILLQNVMMIFCSILPVTVLIFVAYVSNNINAHMMELNEKFNCLLDSNIVPIGTRENEKSIGWINVSAESREYTSLYEGIVAILKYQQFLHGYAMDFTNYINLIFSMYVIPCILLAFFAVLSINEVHGSVQIQIAMLFWVGTSSLYIWSYVGQGINDLNDHLQEMLYHTKWYMLTVEFRKLLVISMILTHQEIKLTWFGIYKIDFEFYVKVLKALYSVVNLVSLKLKSVT